MSETTTWSEASSLRLVGVEFAPTEGRQAESQRDAQRLQRALASEQLDPQSLPQPRLPVVPVYEDASGQQFILEQTPTGPLALPYVSGTPVDTNFSDLRQGGFAALTNLQRIAGAGTQLSGEDFSDFNALNAAALRLAASGGPNAGGNQRGALDGLPQALARGLAQQMLTMGATTLARGGNLQDMLNIVGNKSGADLAGQLGIGAAKQLAGMATQMLFSSLWSVDDESSTAEHVAHKLAQELVNHLQGKLMDQLLTALGLGGAPASLFPGLAAVRVTDTDIQKNVVMEGSPNVQIEFQAAGRLGDEVTRSGVAIYRGAGTTLINGIPAARVIESKSEDGPFDKGAIRTFIGGPSVGALPPSKVPQGVGTTSGATASSNTPARKLSREEAHGCSDIAYKGEIGQTTPDGKFVVTGVVDSPLTGFRAVILKSTLEGDPRVVLAFAGTDPTSIGDMVTNLLQIGPVVPPQYLQALGLATSLAAQHPGQLILTGHSLGGGQASFASLMIGVPAVGINSAPLGIGSRISAVLLGKGDSNLITHHNVEGEFVSSSGLLGGVLGRQPGVICVTEGKPGPSGFFSDHLLGNFPLNKPEICATPATRPVSVSWPGQSEPEVALPN